jgi:hypothetical protein
VDRSNPKFEPIEKGEKNKERKYYCMGCGGPPTYTSIPFLFTYNAQLSPGKGRRIKIAQAKVL